MNHRNGSGVLSPQDGNLLSDFSAVGRAVPRSGADHTVKERLDDIPV
jgi:hypothetical protein